MSVADAEALIKLVDTNGDGQLQLAEFLDLMATPGVLTLLPPPPADAEARLAAFEAETQVVKTSSPVLKEFKKVAAHDPSLTSLALSMSETDNALNMEFRMWPDMRKAAALALISGSPVITSLNLAGCSLNDHQARALAAALGADSKIETLNLERNQLTEPGLKEIIEALSVNTSLRELKLTGQAQTITTGVEVAIAQLLDGGNTTLLKIGPPMRNPNERRRVEAALQKNTDLKRKMAFLDKQGRKVAFPA